MCCREFQHRDRRAAKYIGRPAIDVAFRQVRLQQHHIGIDPPAAEFFKQRVAKQVSVNADATVRQRTQHARFRHDLARIAHINPVREMRVALIGEDFDTMAATNEARKACLLIGRHRRAVPEAANSLRLRALRLGRGALRLWLGRTIEPGARLEAIPPQSRDKSVEPLASHGRLTDAIFVFFQNTILHRPGCDGCVIQSSLLRHLDAETREQQIKEAAARRPVITWNAQSVPRAIPQMRKCRIRKPRLHRFALTRIEKRQRLIVWNSVGILRRRCTIIEAMLFQHSTQQRCPDHGSGLVRLHVACFRQNSPCFRDNFAQRRKALRKFQQSCKSTHTAGATEIHLHLREPIGEANDVEIGIPTAETLQHHITKQVRMPRPRIRITSIVAMKNVERQDGGGVMQFNAVRHNEAFVIRV